MNLLKNQWERISQQLGAMTASQRLVVGLLMAVLVLTLMYTYRYVGKADMMPVLDQNLSAAEHAKIVSVLKREGITYEEGADGRILVPTDKQTKAVGLLSYAKATPNDITTAMDKLASTENLFDTPSKTEDRKRQLRELQLVKVIAEFPGVASASVLLDTGGQRGLTSIKEPVASVSISTNGSGTSPRELANTAADLVRSAVSGLKRSSIMVAVDGKAFVMHEPDEQGGGSSGEFSEIKEHEEARLARRIQEQLSFLGEVRVSVTVDVNRKRVNEKTSDVDPKRFLHKEIETDTKTSESTSPAPPPVEPGVVPNTSTGIGSTAGSGGGTTTNDEITKYQLIPSTKEIDTLSPPGEAVPKAASVRVPESYFIAIWKKINPTATKPPEGTDLQPLFDLEKPQVVKDVKGATGLMDDSAINVSTYNDTLLMAAPMVAASGGGLSIPLMLGDHGKEVAVGALALVSLFMVSNLAKKSAPTPVVAAAAAAAAMNQGEKGPIIAASRDFLSSGEAMAGQVGEEADALSAVELDPDEVKTEQMQAQVADMVSANPEAATTLITRWLDRD